MSNATGLQRERLLEVQLDLPLLQAMPGGGQMRLLRSPWIFLQSGVQQF
jgi:hypothetical protein